MSKGDLAIHVALLVIGLFVSTVALTMGIGSVSRPGPGVFPLTVGVLLIASDITAFKAARGTGIRGTLGGGLHAVSLMMLVFIGWAVATPVVGWMPTTFVSVVAIARIMHMPGWWRPVAFGLAVMITARVLFEWWLGVELPRGQ
jgi:hypothetical protein